MTSNNAPDLTDLIRSIQSGDPMPRGDEPKNAVVITSGAFSPLDVTLFFAVRWKKGKYSKWEPLIVTMTNDPNECVDDKHRDDLMIRQAIRSGMLQRTYHFAGQTLKPFLMGYEWVSRSRMARVTRKLPQPFGKG